MTTQRPPEPPPDGSGPDAATAGVPREQARAAKETLRTRLAGESSIRGVGLARLDDGGYVVVVNVETAVALDCVPEVVNGTPVRSRVVGRVRPLPGHADQE